MNTFNLNSKTFCPVTNSENGRVNTDARFNYTQSGPRFTADYSGSGFTDGHLIGVFTSDDTADLVYHCRADNGDLETGTAKASFSIDDAGLTHIHMDWQWLNLDQSSGRSHYIEVKNDI